LNGPAVTVRMRIDPARSDPNGWVGRIEAALGESIVTQLPVTMAPGQAVFWALTADARGGLRLHAAPAGYRLQSSGDSGSRPSASGAVSREPWTVSRVYLGTDTRGEHPINGLAGGGWFVNEELDLAAVERLRSWMADRLAKGAG
jgi:hypothetical protein